MDRLIDVTNVNSNSIDVQINNVTTKNIISLNKFFRSQVKTVAFHKIKIEENTSELPDELLAFRIGLIPIQILDYSIIKCKNCASNKKIKNTSSNIRLEKSKPICSNCKIQFTLDVESHKDTMDVFSHNFKSNDNRVIINDSHIPIVRLRRLQRIKLTAITKIGVGSQHAKWDPIAIYAYDNINQSDKDYNTRYLFNFNVHIESTGLLQYPILIGLALLFLSNIKNKDINNVSDSDLDILSNIQY